MNPMILSGSLATQSAVKSFGLSMPHARARTPNTMALSTARMASA